jgi:Uma2 family endonuclease
MSPSKQHERDNKNLGAILELLMPMAGIDFEPGGSVTFKRQDLDRGLEPDECYWISNCVYMRQKDEFDAEHDPPPDLVVEVEYSHTVMNRLAILAALRVPEVWRYAARHKLEILILQPHGSYSRSASSPALPWLPSSAVADFMALARTATRPQLLVHLQNWVTQHRP